MFQSQCFFQIQIKRLWCYWGNSGLRCSTSFMLRHVLCLCTKTYLRNSCLQTGKWGLLRTCLHPGMWDQPYLRGWPTPPGILWLWTGTACADPPGICWVGFIFSWINPSSISPSRRRIPYPPVLHYFRQGTWVLSNKWMNDPVNKWGKQLWSTSLYVIQPSSINQQRGRGKLVLDTGFRETKNMHSLTWRLVVPTRETWLSKPSFSTLQESLGWGEFQLCLSGNETN